MEGQEKWDDLFVLRPFITNSLLGSSMADWTKSVDTQLVRIWSKGSGGPYVTANPHRIRSALHASPVFLGGEHLFNNPGCTREKFSPLGKTTPRTGPHMHIYLNSTGIENRWSSVENKVRSSSCFLPYIHVIIYVCTHVGNDQKHTNGGGKCFSRVRHVP